MTTSSVEASLTKSLELFGGLGMFSAIVVLVVSFSSLLCQLGDLVNDVGILFSASGQRVDNCHVCHWSNSNSVFFLNLFLVKSRHLFIMFTVIGNVH